MSDYIPFSIQEEIMKRLPTKSLMQFRSVSKTWKSFIDSPNFISDYSKQKTHQHHLLVSYRDSKKRELKFFSFLDDDTFPQHKLSLVAPIQERRIRPTVLGVSQGLFCLYLSDIDLDGNPRPSSIVLWNPSIQKSIVVASPEVLDSDYLDVIGFGVCPQTNDPKLVHINYHPWQVKVYTLSSRVWRSTPTINRPHGTILIKWHQVTIDKFIYWLSVDWTNLKRSNLIMSFNMTNEELTEIPFPDSLACVSSCDLAISKHNESLVVLETIEEAVKAVFVVWMMERGVLNSFTKLFTITAPDESIQVLHGFRKNNEPIFGARTDYGKDDVFVREFNSEHINYLGMNGISYPSYMETLLLLNQ